MNDFTASNGIVIEREGRAVAFECSGNGDRHSIDISETEALREFFQAEADERLGRWRSAQRPEYVVALSDQFRAGKSGSWVSVLHEPTHFKRHATRSSDFRSLNFKWPDMHFGEVAAEFFDAHPEPKPWRDAKPGEVWDVDMPDGGMRAVTFYAAGRDEPQVVFRDAFTQDVVTVDSEDIRDARRVFPEVP